MTTLLLGATGQLGSAVKVAWPKPHELLSPPHDLVDITYQGDVGPWVTGKNPALIINCAAWTSVDGCEKDPDRAMAVNAKGARHLAEVAKELNAWMIQISTDQCEGDGAKGQYAQSKLLAESEVRRLLPEAHTILRLSCILSAHRNGWLAYVVRNAMRGLSPAVSCQIMAPVAVESVVRAIFHAIEHRSVGTFSVMDTPVVSRHRLAALAIKALGSPVLPNEIPPILSAAPRRVDSVMTTPMLIESAPWESGLHLKVRDILNRIRIRIRDIADGS